MNDRQFEEGMKVRRQILGDMYVDRAEASKTSLDKRFQRFITEFAWGGVWTGKELDRRTRSLLTIALLGALGHENELATHIRATRQTGATPDEVSEALLHVAVYAGVPAANRAFAIAKKTFQELDTPTKGETTHDSA